MMAEEEQEAAIPPDQDFLEDSSEEEGMGGSNATARGPRDDIKVTVKSYQRTGNGNEYTYDIEVTV